MRWDEREEYGEDDRETIEGLRRLAHRAEVPLDLRSEVMARAQQLLPPQRTSRARWWTVLRSWRPHPLAWGPVVAGAFFIAGILAPWPRAGMPPNSVTSEERQVPGPQQPPAESAEVSQTPNVMSYQPPRQESRQQTEPAPAPSTRFSALARRDSLSGSSPASREVMATLPSALYEELQHEAQRRQITIAAILREAAETYVQTHRRPH